MANGYDESMGARPMARVIQAQIKTPLADEVLFGRLKNGGVVRVVVLADDKGEKKKLGFVYPDGPAQPRLERELVVANRERGKLIKPKRKSDATSDPDDDDARREGAERAGDDLMLKGKAAAKRPLCWEPRG